MPDGALPPPLLVLARRLVAPGRGLLDLSDVDGALSSRLLVADVLPSLAAKQSVRRWVLSTPGLPRTVAAAILDAAAFDGHQDGTSPAFTAGAQRILPGFAVRPTVERILADRLRGCRARGALFARCRAPGPGAARGTARVAASSALMCQAAGLVPVIEVVTTDPGDEAPNTAPDAAVAALVVTVQELKLAGVDPRSVVLASDLPACFIGPAPGDLTGSAALASAALAVAVPREIAGVVLDLTTVAPSLDGQPPAALHLSGLRRGTWCAGPSILAEALCTWAGNEDRVPAAQAVLAGRLAVLRAAERVGGCPAVREGG
ncbi:hypothetical protein [Pseudonocardia sp.]|uniref:hypothetical protein n=1 Tax=Pseudonocardia sp. TaxID=60912 RepID=UPI003D0E94DF